MNYRLQKVKEDEMMKVIKFINYCFDVKFEQCVGKLYNKENTFKNHYIIMDNNNIIAAICINQSEWIFEKEKLKVAGIGSVCVHPDYRNNGIMQFLMNESNKIIREMNSDISILSGKYERYNHFNYESNNSCLVYNINYDKKKDYNDFEFIDMNKLSTKDIIKCNQIHEKKIPYIRRSNNTFVESCYQWEHKSFGIKFNDKLIGYIVIDKDMNLVEEIELNDETKLLKVLNYFMYKNNKETLNLKVPKSEYSRILQLQNYKVSSIENNKQMCQIINFEHVIEILLNNKRKYRNLKKGCLVIKIKKYGFIKIQVDDEIKVTKEDNIKFDIELSYIDALKLFLTENDKIQGDVKDICKSWFPLDIYLHVADLI